jgi:hypothetical protein
MKRHAVRFLFEDGDFPRWSEADDLYTESVESSIRRSFLQADQALSDEASVSRSSGTTALTALILGRFVQPPPPPLFCLFSFASPSPLIYLAAYDMMLTPCAKQL